MGDEDALLDPAETITCSATYVVTKPDIDGGSVTNTATGSESFNGDPVTSNIDHHTIEASDPRSRSTSSRRACHTTIRTDVLNYTYQLTNTGNVTIGGPFTIDDDRSTNEDCPAVPSSLAPGASTTCTGTYTVTQDDIDFGSVTNMATGAGSFGGPVVSDAGLGHDRRHPEPGRHARQDRGCLGLRRMSQTSSRTRTNWRTTATSRSADPLWSTTMSTRRRCPFRATTATAGSMSVRRGYSPPRTTSMQDDLDGGEITNNATGSATFDGDTYEDHGLGHRLRDPDAGLDARQDGARNRLRRGRRRPPLQLPAEEPRQRHASPARSPSSTTSRPTRRAPRRPRLLRTRRSTALARTP